MLVIKFITLNLELVNLFLNIYRLLMKNFTQSFEIIYKKYCEVALANTDDSRHISKIGMARFFNISQGKMIAWEKGQWPMPADLEIIAKRLGFGYKWLVTGEGDPFSDGEQPTQQAEHPQQAACTTDTANALAELQRENEHLHAMLAAKNDIIKANEELLHLYRNQSGYNSANAQNITKMGIVTAEEGHKEYKTTNNVAPGTNVVQESAGSYSPNKE